MLDRDYELQAENKSSGHGPGQNQHSSGNHNTEKHSSSNPSPHNSHSHHPKDNHSTPLHPSGALYQHDVDRYKDRKRVQKGSDSSVGTSQISGTTHPTLSATSSTDDMKKNHNGGNHTHSPPTTSNGNNHSLQGSHGPLGHRSLEGAKDFFFNYK